MTDKTIFPSEGDSPHTDAAGQPKALSADAVSGFLHRNSVLEVAGRLFAQCNELCLPLTALWLDIDRFRQVNDSLGHAGGDQLISGTASRIRGVAPLNGACIRMGSDEFVILIPGLQGDAAEHLARRLLSDMELPMAIGDTHVHPSVSIGIAFREQEDTPARLLERADRAMIDAKRHDTETHDHAGMWARGIRSIEIARCGPVPGRVRHALDQRPWRDPVERA